MLSLTATHLNYFFICQRKCWLFGNEVQMEHGNEAVAAGKLLSETSYAQKAERYSELPLSYEWTPGLWLTGKIDHFDAVNGVVHEVKKSPKMEPAHEWQVRWYLWLLQMQGTVATGLLDYPTQRKTSPVVLDDAHIALLQAAVVGMQSLIEDEKCPPVIRAKICASCAYQEFCYAGEEE